MKDRLTEALARLEARFGRGLGEQIERCELGRDGMLYLTALLPQQSRWFADDGAASHEIFPTQDASLPASTLLGDARQRVLSWRPGRRVVLSQGSAEEQVIIKGFRSGKVAKAAGLHQLVADHCRDESSFLIPPLLGWREDLACLVMAHLRGGALDSSPAGLGHFGEIGRCLHHLQERVPRAGLPLHGWKEELGALDAAAERALAITSLPAGWPSVREALASAADPLAVEPLVACHRDLHDQQLLIVGNRIALLDYELFVSSSPWLDCINFICHLQLRHLQFPARIPNTAWTSATQEFLNGYGAPDALAADSAQTLQAACFLRLAAVYAVRPRWNGLPETLLRLANESIS